MRSLDFEELSQKRFQEKFPPLKFLFHKDITQACDDKIWGAWKNPTPPPPKKRRIPHPPPPSQ